MGWSLDRLPPIEPDLQDRFFLTVGRALYLASEFERKCKWLLRIAKIANHVRETQEFDGTLKFMEALKDPMLRPTIEKLQGFKGFDGEEVKLAENAAVARNHIAHEAARIGPLSAAGELALGSSIDDLRSHVRALAEGDNLVSTWVYEVSEKEPAPVGIQRSYVAKVETWVFSPWDCL